MHAAWIFCVNTCNPWQELEQAQLSAIDAFD